MKKHDNLSPLLVTAAIIEKKGKFLATRRPAGKKHPLLWEFPGGKMEAGESPQQALQRELREELAIEVSVENIFDAVYHNYNWGPVLILAYHCHWQEGEIQNLDVAEHCWGTPSQLRRLDFLPADRPLLERLELENTDLDA